MIKSFVFSPISHLAASFQFFQAVLGVGALSCWHFLNMRIVRDFKELYYVKDFSLSYCLGAYVSAAATLLAVISCTITTIMACHYKDRSEDYRVTSDFYKHAEDLEAQKRDNIDDEEYKRNDDSPLPTPKVEETTAAVTTQVLG